MVDYVITGLVKRRAHVAGEIERTHEYLRKLLADLESLDATILQFDPDYQVEAIRPKAFRPPKDWSNRGQMTRICLSILRQAPEPLTTRDTSYKQLAERLEALGVHDSERNINNKVSRGGFTAVFFVQCLVAIGCHTLHLEDG